MMQDPLEKILNEKRTTNVLDVIIPKSQKIKQQEQQ